MLCRILLYNEKGVCKAIKGFESGFWLLFFCAKNFLRNFEKVDFLVDKGYIGVL